MIASFLPIWLLAAVGYLTGRTRILGDQGELVLGRFVFHIAMPASLFATLSGASLFVLGRYAVHLSRTDLLAVVVCSALPTDRADTETSHLRTVATMGPPTPVMAYKLNVERWKDSLREMFPRDRRLLAQSAVVR